ncbi:MAG: hypothetical protein ACYTFK_04620 [Planctomycetota bacterium]|jgi:hypothetical protein
MKRLFVAVIILSAVLGPALALGQTQKNPFAPLAKAAVRQIPELIEPIEKDKDSEAIQLKLNGIIFSKSRPVAIINDAVVEIGGLVAGRRVSAISISQVELQYYDKKEILKITPRLLFSISSKNQTQGDIEKSSTK